MISLLYVDDESGLLEIGKLFLEQNGQFHVDTAISATDALTMMQSKVYDAIISDYQMPGMDGIELLRKVRASGSTIPFIIFTGRGREEIVIQALNEGADFYIQKGGDPKPQFVELQHKIRMAVQRRTAEASIAKGKEQHQEILQTAMDGYMLLDTEGHILEVNKAYARMSGYSQQELLLMRISDLKATGPAEDQASHIQNIVTQGNARFESQHRRKDGNTVYIEINAHYKPDEGGRIIAFINDITERKQKEEEMIFKNTILSTQQEASPEGILIVDDEGKVLQYNQKFVELWSIPAGFLKSTGDETMLQHVADQVTNPDAFLSRVRYLYTHKEEKSFEELRLRDGRILERFSAPMFAESGTYYGRVWYFRDITKRKQAEEALYETSNRLSFALRSAKAGTWDWDFPTGRLVWSPEFFELFGIPHDVSPSFEAWLDHLHPDDRTIAMERTNQSVTEHRDLWNEYRVLLPDGTMRWIGASGKTLYTDSGEPQRMSGVCIDITERKLSEKEVLNKSEQLNSAYEELLSGEEELRQHYKELALSQRALEESEVRYRSLFENLLNGVAYCQMIYDDHGRPENFVYLVVNDAFENLTGLTNVVGKKVTDVIPGIRDLTPELFEIYGRVARTGEPETFEIDFKPLNSILHLSVFSMETGYFIAVFEDVTERRKAEEALRAGEAFLNNIIQIAPVGIGVSIDRVIQSFNDQFCQITGYTSGEIVGHSARMLYPSEEEYDYVGRELFGKMHAQGTVETRWTRKDGTIIDVQFSTKPIDTSNLSAGVIFTALDITERKRAEMALRDSEERFRLLASNATDVIWTMDFTGRFTYISPSVERLRGYTPEEVLAQTIDEALAPASAELIRKRFEAILAENGEGKPLSEFRGELEQPRKDGSAVWTEVTSKGFYNERNELVGIIGVSRDISDRKRGELERKEREEVHHTIIHTAMDGFVMLDAKGNVLEANEAYCLMSGYTMQEILTMNINDFEVVESAAATASHIQHIIQQGQDRFLSKHRRKDGSTYDIESSVQYKPDSGGRFIVFIRDITREKQAEEEVLKANRIMEESLVLFKTLNEHAPVGFAFMDRDYRFVHINGTMAEINGFPVEEHIGRTPEELLPEMWPFIKPIYENVQKTGIPATNIELTGKTPADPDIIRHWICNYYPVRTADQSIIGIGVIVIDITERIKSQDALRESEERYRSLVENINEVVFTVDQDGLITYFSPIGERHYGYSPGDLLGKPFTGVIFPDDVPALQKRFHEIGRGIIAPFEWRLVHKDGSISWVRTSTRPVADRTGHPSFFGIISDISKEKKTEETLRQSEERYKNISSTTTDFVFSCVKPEDGCTYSIDWMAGAVERITGYTIGEVNAMGCWRCIVHPDDTPVFDTNITWSPVGTSSAFILRILTKTGTVKWLEVNTTNILVEGCSQESRVFGGCRDITERVQAEKLLSESENKFASIFHGSPVALTLVSSEDGKFVDVNDAFLSATGYTRDEVIGKTSEELEIFADNNEYERLATILREHRIVNDMDIRCREKNGEVRPCLFSSGIILIGGKPHILSTVTDITERKRVEGALLQAHRKLTLLSGITRHDISNQLFVLNGFLKLLHQKNPDEGLEDYFTRITKASSRISSMIQFTREYEEIGVKAPAWHDCHTLVDKAAKDAPLGGVLVINDLPANKEVFADPLIVKVFYNLMDNAARYGGKITTIRFFVQESGGDHILVCEDDGEGIPADDKEKIFERGFGKNTGLGLALAREILDITGITITETGEPGKGARFEISVPEGAWRGVGNGAKLPS